MIFTDNIIVHLKAALNTLLKSFNNVGDLKPEKCSRSDSLQENIDIAHL